MAPKPSPDSLIHCAVCGEDYSATYRRCPFCGAKNTPAPRPAPPSSRGRSDPDDGYVFDGQDLFDDEPEDAYLPARPKGGKRLAEKSPGPFNDLQVNWPRLITFLCSLIIIIAALVIVFTVIYPQLHGPKEPPATVSDQPSAPPSQPLPPASQPVSTAPVPNNTDPVPTAPVIGVGEDEPTGITLNKVDFTLRPGESFQLVANVTPSDWSGTVTWTSTDTSLATVSDNGLVAHANPDVTNVRLVVITARAGTLETECKVYIAGPKTTPAASEPPVQSDPPVTITTAPGGNVTVGRPGTVVNADGGLRVRPDPSTSNPPIATLFNGNSITVLSDAGGGWYQISFSGAGGVATTGYIMGDYISTN